MSGRKGMYPLGHTWKHFKNIKQDILLTGIRDVHFLKIEWENFQPERSVSFKYLAFRGFWMCAIIFIFFSSIAINDGLTLFYPIFLSHWSIMTQAFYSILFFIRVRMGYSWYRKNRQIHPERQGQPEVDRNSENNSSLGIVWLQLMIWFLQPFCWVLPILVTIGFWTTIYKPTDYKGITPYAFPATCMLHGANVGLAIIDVAVIAIPVHAAHFLYLVWYAIVYAIVSYVNHVMNKMQAVYDIDNPLDYINSLDWKNTPGAAFLASFVVILIAIFIFYFLYIVYALRLLIVSYFKKNTYEEHFYDSEGHNCPHCARGHPRDLIHDHSGGLSHDHNCACEHTVAPVQPQANKNPGGQEPEILGSPIDVPTES